MKIKKILITGGTGLVGKKLCALLQKEGYEVTILSRSKNPNSPYPTFTWDYQSRHLEAGAFEGVDAIIHLAGAGVADKRWSAERKKVILESRTMTSQLLYDQLKSTPNQVKTIIAASAIGIYGIENSPNSLTEESPIGTDYLADVTKEWEVATSQFENLNVRLVQMRIGIVLSDKGGALMKLLEPPVAAALGQGDQYMSWIHMEDVLGMFLWAIKNESATGPYNVVAPTPLTNHAFTKMAAKIFKKPFMPVPVPKFVLQIMLGQMAEILLGGSKISSQKIVDAGYHFKFPDFEAAVKDLKS
jgi:uncharacterized protein (TIGR01777 family)